MKTLNIVSALLVFVLLWGCGPENGKNGDPKPDTTKKVRANVPAFNADSAYFYVKAQVDMGPRVPNGEVHKQCSQWLEQKLTAFGAKVTMQPIKVRAFNGTMLNGYNIIGSYNPDASVRVMLCSHWDSRPWCDHDPDSTKWRTPVDGANDGASGVGVLLEVARILQKNNPGIGVDIIFFDAEDYGEPQWDSKQYSGDNWGLGSQYWAKNTHVANYSARYGILLDMVGVPSANFAQEGFSLQYAADIVSKVWSAGYRAGYDNYFVNTPGGMVNDDHLYVNKYARIPTIDVIHYDPNTQSGFFRYWHTSQDNMDHIDRNTLKAVGQTVLTVIFEEGLPS
jgi:hypothetical protein